MSESIKRHKTRQVGGSYNTVIAAATQCVKVSVKARRPAHAVHALRHGVEHLIAPSARSACDVPANVFAHFLPLNHSKWHPVHESVSLQTNVNFT